MQNTLKDELSSHSKHLDKNVQELARMFCQMFYSLTMKDAWTNEPAFIILPRQEPQTNSAPSSRNILSFYCI